MYKTTVTDLTLRLLRKTVLLIMLFFIFQHTPSAAENTAGGNGDDLRYENELLIQARDSFISENGDLPVKMIIIQGLEKTKKSVILNETDISYGDRLSKFSPHLLINRLKKKNLFTDLQISYIRENDSVIIELSLVEKWTIIPLPMYYSNGETSTYGIYILESNFLGYDKVVFTGGTYSGKSRSAIFGYIDPSVFGSQFAANLFLIYRNSIDQNGTADKNIFSEYSSRQKTVRIDFGYSFNNGIKLYLSEGYNEGIVDEHYTGSFNIPDSEKFYLSGAVFKLDLLKYYEYFYYGFKGELKYYTHIPDGDGKQYHTADFILDYSYKIFRFHRITISSSGSAGDSPAVLEKRISGKTGTRTLPADIISADNFINYSIIYEYPFLKFSRGAVTLLGLWEQGTFNRDNIPFCNYYGPGGGILLYLKHISFPAVGFNYAHNMATGSSEFSVNIGYTF